MDTKSKKIIDLTFAEFNFLLQEHNLSVDKNSLLLNFSDIKPDGDFENLKGKGLLEKQGDFHDALVAICEPDVIFNSILVFTETAATSSYFSKRSNSEIIAGCWPLNDKKVRISFPLEPTDIISNSLTVMAVNDSMGSLSHIEEKRFFVDGFVAFAAAVDAVRTVLLASMLERQQISSFTLPKSMLDEMLQEASEDKPVDARWLTALFRSLFPAFAELFKKVNKVGVKELVEYKLIEIDGDEWTPSSELIEIASNWLQPLPAVYHESFVLNSKKEEKTSSLTLRGSGPLCLIEEKIEKNIIKFHLRSIDNNTYWLELIGKTTPYGGEVKLFDLCPECGTKREDKALFCGKCGVDLKRK